MSRISEVNPYLLFLFNLVAILAISWFASWTYLYSLSGLWQRLSVTDFSNLLYMSMTISTLIIIDGATLLRRSGILRKGYEHVELERKQVPATSTQRPRS